MLIKSIARETLGIKDHRVVQVAQEEHGIAIDLDLRGGAGAFHAVVAQRRAGCATLWSNALGDMCRCGGFPSRCATLRRG